jgi:hypothetical protein
MSYTMEDFRRDYVKAHLKDLTPQERLEGLSAEEVLRSLPLEDWLECLLEDEIKRFREKQKLVRPSPRRKPRRKK